MEFDLRDSQIRMTPGDLKSTQLPIAYSERTHLWPEITHLTELTWFSKAIYIRIIQYLQMNSGLTDIARINTAQDKRFTLALLDLSSIGLISVNLSQEERLHNFSVQKLKQMARYSGIKLGVIPTSTSKDHICRKIAENIDNAQLTTFLEQEGIPYEQIRPLLSDVGIFKKYMWAENHRIDLYMNWLVKFVRPSAKTIVTKPRTLSRISHAKASILNPYEGDLSIRSEEIVPYFEQYYASPEMMNKSQRRFFDFLVNEIDHGRFPSVQGNVSYLFAYVYPSFITKWDKQGYEYVYDRLLNLIEAYPIEEKFVFSCKLWAYECLLGSKKYDEYLELTAPQDILPSRTFHSQDRCNVLHHLKYPVHASDILSLFGWKGEISLTEYTQEHLSTFADILDDVFSEAEKSDGPWLERMLSVQKDLNPIPKTLFVGVPVDNKPILGFPFYDFRAEYWYFMGVITDLMRKAENRLRESHDLPKIGEGWISEMSLFYSIQEAFPQIEVIHHGRPKWLGRQHLDIWLPRWRIAVEYHGLQHFQSVEFFGGDDVFEATKERDERKQRLCEENNVTLIVVTSDDAHDRIIETIKKFRRLQ